MIKDFLYRQLKPEDFRTLASIVEDLKKHRGAWPFVQAVNPAEAPDYYLVISEPMGESFLLHTGRSPVSEPRQAPNFHNFFGEVLAELFAESYDVALVWLYCVHAMKISLFEDIKSCSVSVCTRNFGCYFWFVFYHIFERIFRNIAGDLLRSLFSDGLAVGLLSN